MSPDGNQLDAFAVDVHAILERSVANLHSHLVTRPTGRAVRFAIERQLEEMKGPVLSLVDLKSVAILDFSCADEVVAKLLLRDTDTGDASSIPVTYFVFQGLREHHLEPIESVLERRSLMAVAQRHGGIFELLGTGSPEERSVWLLVEERGRIPSEEVTRLFPESAARDILMRLLARRVIFRHPLRGDLLALSALVQEMG